MTTSITQSPLWQGLEQQSARLNKLHLRNLCADPERFSRCSLEWDGLLLDFSKQRIDGPTLDLLRQLWQWRDGPGWLARMITGEPINHTEGRAVLHMALRAAPDQAILCQGRDVMPDVAAVLDRMEDFCRRIHQGQWRGAGGEMIRNVVNIGIGGSDLGPKMATQALNACQVPGLKLHYVSNVDGAHLAATLADLDPATTLFIIASKTFTTQETMQNAASARQWLVATLGEGAVARHFVAVSTNLKAVAEFGIDPANAFAFWDWVGGRFSLWSAIGLPLALAVGFGNFRRLLEGGRAMDRHFLTAPAEANLPLTLALLEVWNTDFLGAQTRALLPYSQSLELLPRYLQQLEMESNGKRVDRAGQVLDYPSAPILWGEAGTNGQHAFYQLLHQGERLVPCDFIACREADLPLPGHQALLLANCLAQSKALMQGKTLEEARAELLAGDASQGQAAALAPYKVFPGNQPSTTLLLPRLDPYTLGQLIALFEHKVFALGVLWNLNSFDQWGVEYGKQLAKQLLPMIEGQGDITDLDSSSAGLIAYLKRS
ncbi:glucose-6-phosphate isomerase [Denitratisoma oestradiolicum]|uniref:Glucose-6-phosphate isomerase n=1 Tax=Denitratisoma oestradiolicum TaxID=311182 RepID=A0A6S6YDE5_9PROT|nr:glucose-6-phosphate isomerase [Denitratisoma oestradiolicum]TWO81777.1 glucose-6-phosphate isomerase [Denitratisoma oestradiolicum]CAB1370736.1 glucosephosphate isomerase [Denitratisoma oestradiolicum]